MNVFRFINRMFHNAIFRLTSHGIRLVGKGVVKDLKCTNNGSNNVAVIDAGASLSNCTLYYKGNGNSLHVSCGTHLQNVTFWFEDDCNSIEIGQMVTSEGNIELAACEGCKITIGNDCMFSYGIHVRNTDSHSILNENGERVNKAADITIGNHVWVGADVMVLKGSNIPDNSVVGARSMVTSSLKAKPNSMIVGTPAKEIKEDIKWRREK